MRIRVAPWLVLGSIRKHLLKMKVSVIIPTLGAPDYLFECLHCLDGQSAQEDLYDVWVVLNGEQKPHYQRIKNFINDLGRGNYILAYSPDLGVSSARNYALDHSDSDAFLFVDNDDKVSRCFVEKMTLTADDTSIFACRYVAFDDAGNESPDYVNLWYDSQTNINNHFKNRKALSNACGKLIPRSVVGDYRFDVNFKQGEDSLFMATISASFLGVVRAPEEAVYYRRITVGSASRSLQSKSDIFKNTIMLCCEYTKLLFREKYSRMLVLSRIVATLLRGARRLLSQ